MPADSLLTMARRVAARNVLKISDVGNMPYELVRPILLKVESPEKLHQLELNSPQLFGYTAELWLNFMKRDIPDYHLKPHVPDNPRSWYKAYKKLKKEAGKASSDAEALLKATLSGIQDRKDQNTAELASSAVGAALWSKTDALGPSRKARAVYGYMSGKTGSKGASKMTAMQKIRREARSAGTGVMGRPTHELQKKLNGVTRAPEAFVEDVKRMKVLQQVEAKKATSPPPRRARGIISTARSSKAPWDLPPKHIPQPAAANGIEPYDLTNDREARLQALKAGKPLPPMRPRPAYDPKTQSVGNENGSLTLDFLETDSENYSDEDVQKPMRRGHRDDDDDLFGDAKLVKNRQRDQDDELFGESSPPRRTQRDTDDELFGTTEMSNKKRQRVEDDDDDVSPPPKMPKSNTNHQNKKPHLDDSDEDNITPPPASKPLKSRLIPTLATMNGDTLSPHRKLLKPEVGRPISRSRSPPINGDTLSPHRKLLKPEFGRSISRSGSPMLLSPANSPRLQATRPRRREAPSLFMKKK